MEEGAKLRDRHHPTGSRRSPTTPGWWKARIWRPCDNRRRPVLLAGDRAGDRGVRISQRAQAVAPFFAMEFGKHAAALESQGHHVIKLSIGEPDFGAPP